MLKRNSICKYLGCILCFTLISGCSVFDRTPDDTPLETGRRLTITTSPSAENVMAICGMGIETDATGTVTRIDRIFIGDPELEADAKMKAYSKYTECILDMTKQMRFF